MLHKHSFLLFIFTCISVCDQTVRAQDWTLIYEKPFPEIVVNTSQGLLLGNFDQRGTMGSANGIEISKDLGKTWQAFGLQSRGITSIYEDTEYFYATTFFVKDNWVGLFKTQKSGDLWEAVGPKFPMTSVCTNSHNIIIGSFSNGMWVANKTTQTFIQKIGAGFFGPKFNTVYCKEKVVLAASTTKVYISTDYGESFTEILELANKQFKHFLIDGNNMYAGSLDQSGLYYSPDFGINWTKNTQFGSVEVLGLQNINDCIYAGKYDNAQNIYSMYASCDRLETWTNTNLNINSGMKNINWIFGEPIYIVTTVHSKGLYAKTINDYKSETFSFLDIPWHTQNNLELFDKISAYFDHSYPLLGSSIKEPANELDTIQTFAGLKGRIPELYYSSHSGIDFALPYDTEIIAPADGVASYFFCNDCGHAISINHLNGYTTEYMHLQESISIPKVGTIPVTKGTKLGKVGLSGKTTGPHLHFEVKTDEPFPFSRTDPFGWQSKYKPDPWPNFIWNNNTGSVSKYLWTQLSTNISKTIDTSNNATPIVSDNKIFNVSLETQILPFYFELKSMGTPSLNEGQKQLVYLPNTSFILNLFNTVGDSIKELEQGININVVLNPDLLLNVIGETIKLYTLNPVTFLWETVNSIYDSENHVIKAKLNHLSAFAVFGVREIESPKTSILIDCEFTNSWCTSYPTISVVKQNQNVDKIFYSMNNGVTWNEYTEPIVIQKDGFTKLIYKGMDVYQNIETPNEDIIRVNTINLWLEKIKIEQSKFNTDLSNNSPT